MRALIQRVTRAQISEVPPSNKMIASIGPGLVILVGFEETDTPVSIDQMVQKIRSLRIFSDAEGKLNLAGPDANAEYLVVSQFTLYAECKYGNRPSFIKAAPKLLAQQSYDQCVKTFERLMGTEVVKHGEFGSDLNVELVNNGPVTIWLDSKEVI